MSVLFYRSDPAAAAGDAPLPSGLELRVWRPGVDGAPPQGSRRWTNFVWWLFSHAGVFADREFAEITVWSAGRLAHRHLLSPRWGRFPFMAPEDRQLGDVWTDPAFRRQGLAGAALADTRRRCASLGGALWYVVEDRNAASVGLAESLGFRLVGSGRRTQPLGVRAIGRFRLDASGASAARPSPPPPTPSGSARRSV